MTDQIARSSQRHRKFSLLVVGMIVLTAPVLHSQTPSAAAMTPVQADPAATGPAKLIPFEVVSIRPTVGGRAQGDFFTDDGYIRRGITPHILLTYMSEKLIGVPNWCLQERYDVVAKVAEADVPAWKNMNLKQKSLAMRPMLEDRFRLKWHMETRMESGYELVIAKNGSKLKEAIPGEIYSNGPKEKDGTPRYGVFMAFGRESGLIGQAASMEQIEYYLAMFANGPVVDKTGLAGTYDFELRAIPESNSSVPAARAAPEPDSSMPTLAGPVNEGPSLFPAVQEQLGLKLVAAKVPVEYVVVDHIEQPTAN